MYHFRLRYQDKQTLGIAQSNTVDGYKQLVRKIHSGLIVQVTAYHIFNESKPHKLQTQTNSSK